jgi:hypothetical protein
MSKKTEPSMTPSEQAEFSPAFLRWLITLTAATLLMAFFLRHGLVLQQLRILPWISAASITIQEGLREFEGKGGTVSSQTQQYAMLASVLAGFVLGPTLLLFSWRALLLQKNEKQRVLQPWNIAFIVGGILLVPNVLPSIPMVFTRPLVFQQMKSSQAIVEAKVMMMGEMAELSFDARQFRARPFGLGGGGGSYFGYNIPPEKATTRHGSYITMEVGEEMIVFKGTSVQYPASSIVMVLDKDGSLKNWTFGGQFH